MNTVQGYLSQTNEFQLNCRSKPMFPEENHVVGHKHIADFSDFSVLSLINGSFHIDESSYEGQISDEVSIPFNGPSTFDESSSSEGESFKEIDHSDATLRFISQMLMEEEDLENKPCMLLDCLALQATEKSLYDALNNNHVESPIDHFNKTSSVSSSDNSSDIATFLDSNWSHGNLESFVSPSEVQYPYSLQSDLLPYTKEIATDPFRALDLSSGSQFDPTFNASREKKNRCREDGDLTEENRRNKQLANDVISESEPLEIYDEVLLCSNKEHPACGETDQIKSKKKPQRGRPGKGKKQGVVTKEFVDLRGLLLQCAQAVASYDRRSVDDLLIRIRQHSSHRGDGTERLAHYFANALEARLAGTGRACYAAFSSRISAAEFLRSYQTFIMACPFRKMSNFVANKTIKKLARKATTLHVIDFGILYGFQWPCLIQSLSERPGGPPKLRITGIDFPQPGFRPAERVEDTGRRLDKYCKRFRVPFEFHAIAQKWETIKVEDLKIEKNEVLVVNCLYRFQNVLDETLTVNSPRDAVLTLIKKIDPYLFIHGVVNGAYNTPFFLTRFREALFHFSSLFDMFEAAVPREDPNRVLFEEEVFGVDAMNVIACEGTERIDRPETYKQWQARNLRAGFRQVRLDEEIIEYVRRKVKMDYHKDFSVDEDGKWMLQGWKGRVHHAISCWLPANK